MGYNSFMTTIEIPLLSNKRECGTCTKCCEGWLSGDIKGYKMFPGKPCFFVKQGVGCKDYVGRPEEPCKKFFCEWINILEMPEEFKPELVGVIVHKQHINNIPVWSIAKAPNNPSIQLLSWLINHVISIRENIMWTVDDKDYFFGSEEFCKEMYKKFNKQSGESNVR